MDYASRFSERLTQLRLQRGVSARDMSLSLGQSESYINKIENRRTMPSKTGFFYICEYLQVEPKEFFDFQNTAPTKRAALETELGKLSAEKAEHILQVIRDLNNG